jgi:Uma2 family endonuclease
MSVRLQKRRFTVEEYYRMAEAGILSEDDRVELIDGEVVQMPAIGSRHAACVRRFTQLFSERAANRALVSVQNPVRLSKYSEPQPDLAMLRPRGDFYASGHPGPEDVLLIVEVADTSVEYDRTVKVPLYARAAIPEVWLVDLASDIVEVYRRPSTTGYQIAQRANRRDTLSVEALPGITVSVGDVLG